MRAKWNDYDIIKEYIKSNNQNIISTKEDFDEEVKKKRLLKGKKFRYINDVKILIMCSQCKEESFYTTIGEYNNYKFKKRICNNCATKNTVEKTTKWNNYEYVINKIKNSCNAKIITTQEEFNQSILAYKKNNTNKVSNLTDNIFISGICLTCGKNIVTKNIHSFMDGHVYCKECSRKTGEYSNNWKGGISSLTEHFRANISTWKTNSQHIGNYKCVITGNPFGCIHHLYSFNLIVQKFLSDNHIEIKKNANDYEEEYLKKITLLFEKFHDSYGLGVCLSNNIHKLYHKLYSNDNNIEQFNEFTNRYANGEFKEVI